MSSTPNGSMMGDHAQMMTITEAAGKTKGISAEGLADTKNDLMLYSIIEADSHDIAARAFEHHPHLQIPQSSIQVVEIRPLGAM